MNLIKKPVAKLAVCLMIVLPFFLWRSTDRSMQEAPEVTYDANTIRATYPVYEDKQRYLRLFQQEHDIRFAPFVGWRRVAVNATNNLPFNLDPTLRTRMSSGHAINGSWWFFGGSTMFGQGSYDNETIPSIFHQISGKAVLNLGELGWNAAQSLMQLNVLIAMGYRPEGIIFYDGYNDGYQYCGNQIKQAPGHLWIDEFTHRIRNFEQLKKQYEHAATNIRWVDYILAKANVYLKKLAQIFKRRELPKQPIKTDARLQELSPKNSYLICDSDQMVLDASVKAMLGAWQTASNIAQAYNIEAKFVLHPNAIVSSDFLELSYLDNAAKQKIIDEKKSFNAFYTLAKQRIRDHCSNYNNCDQFLDFSDAFNSYEVPIYIDTVHVGPFGNKVIAEKLFGSLAGKH
jgi:hypothetical protein